MIVKEAMMSRRMTMRRKSVMRRGMVMLVRLMMRVMRIVLMVIKHTSQLDDDLL